MNLEQSTITKTFSSQAEHIYTCIHSPIILNSIFLLFLVPFLNIEIIIDHLVFYFILDIYSSQQQQQQPANDDDETLKQGPNVLFHFIHSNKKKQTVSGSVLISVSTCVYDHLLECVELFIFTCRV
jgi:hypothetical protein